MSESSVANAQGTINPSAALKPYLNPNETLVWTGTPDPKAYAMQKLTQALFGIPFLGFAIFWTSTALWMSAGVGGGFGIIFPLFGLPFIAIGLWLVSTPFIRYINAKKVAYGITNQRAMILSMGWPKSFKAYWPKDITEFDIRPDGNNKGSLIFAKEYQRGPKRSTGTPTNIGFWGVNDLFTAQQALQTLSGR